MSTRRTPEYMIGHRITDMHDRRERPRERLLALALSQSVPMKSGRVYLPGAHERQVGGI